MPAPRKKLAFVYRNPVHFVRLDSRLLAEDWDVTEVRFSFSPLCLWRLWRAVGRCDVAFAWFGNVWAALAVLFARLRGRKSVVVAGGYDADVVPEIGYGLPLHPVLRHFARYAFTRADLVLPVSPYMERRLRAFCRPRASLLVPNAVDLPDVVPDPAAKEAFVLTIGLVHQGSSPIKGHYLFLETAARLPDVPFVLYGRQMDATAGELRRLAPPNVVLVDDAGRDSLLAYLLRARVYAQFSATESFGVALVEAMRCGATPVVTPRGALPEMVGDAGIVAQGMDPDALARAVRQALDRGPAVNERAMDLAGGYTLGARRRRLRRMAALLGFPRQADGLSCARGPGK
ncbi:glycosyltransferase [Solidesulfovibrio sp.]|uniref:glycosyltransferase family 4 protein n=1 Tax=Solidesulfovibrio sp. TaxID=2910990 RepID=UPI0026031260|nr:glycosyltransferase [Solidesulfovibrio sp.]